MKVFIIDRRVRFNPSLRTLEPVDKTRGTLYLHAPVCECLLLFLTHNGETLSHRFLSDEVWEKRGNYVSMNTLYQNVAAIRRGLKSAGLDDNILKTVPKLGFQFNASLIEEEDITLAPSATAQPYDREPDELVINEEEVEEEKPEIQFEPNMPHTFPNSRDAFAEHSSKIIALALSGVFIFGLFYLFNEIKVTKSFFSSYNHIGEVSKCDLFSSSSSGNKSTDTFNKLMLTKEITCTGREIAYLTFNINYQHSSLIICDTYITRNNVNCSSVSYTGNVDDNL